MNQSHATPETPGGNGTTCPARWRTHAPNDKRLIGHYRNMRTERDVMMWLVAERRQGHRDAFFP